MGNEYDYSGRFSGRIEPKSSSPMQKSAWTQTCAQNSVQAGLDLLRSGQYSDLIVRCGTRSWKVHQNILGPRCAFFNGCLRGQFRESWSREIDLGDDDGDAVQGLLEHVYGFGYPGPITEEEMAYDVGSTAECEGDSKRYWLQHFKIYEVAEKYLMEGLIEMAREKILEQLSAPPPQPIEGTETTYSAPIGYFTLLSTLFNVQTRTLPMTPPGGPEDKSPEPKTSDFKSAVIDTIISNWDWMVAQIVLLEMLEEMPELALEVMKGFAARVKDLGTEKCNGWRGENWTGCQHSYI